MKKHFDITLTIVSVGFAFFFGYRFMYAAWNPPLVAPTGNNADAPINVGTSAQGKMGNFGIGTTAPTAALQISSYLKIFSNNAVATDMNYFRGASDHMVINANGTLYLNYPENNAGMTRIGEALFVQRQGSVGIGTAGPTQKLDVAGSVRSTGNTIMNNTSPTIYLQDSDNRSSMIHANSNLLYFLRANGTNSMTWEAYNGKWPLYLNMENNDAVFGGNVNMQDGWLQYVQLSQRDCYHRTQNLANGEFRCGNGYYMAGLQEDGDGMDNVYCCRP